MGMIMNNVNTAHVHPSITPTNRAQIYEHFFSHVPSPSANTPPICTIIGGGVAAGKNTLRQKLFDDGVISHTMHLHDPDAVIQMLSGYKDQIHEITADMTMDTDTKMAHMGALFGQWDPVARAMAVEMRNHALSQRCDILFERTLAIPEDYDFIARVRDAGYHIKLYGIYSHPDQAFERAQYRALKIGRYIARDIIEDRTQKFRAMWGKYNQLADQAILFDNSGTYGAFPVIYERAGNTETIHMADIYRDFDTSNYQKS